MHTVEAFLALYDAINEQKYLKRAGRIIDRVISWAKDNNWRIPEHFTSDWVADLECNKDKPDDPFKPYGATPGHGIEWGRLITQWACATYKDSDEKNAYIDAAKNLYNQAITDAWNADGAPGIAYTTDWEGKPVVHDRMHWTSNRMSEFDVQHNKCNYSGWNKLTWHCSCCFMGFGRKV